MNSAYQLGYWMMPEQALVPVAVLLIIVGLGLWAIGLRRIGRAVLVAGICIVALPAVLGPVFDEIFAHVPVWLILVFFIALGFYFVRLVLTLFLGKEGAGTLMAMGVASGMRGLFRFPQRLVRWSRALRRLLQSADPRKRAIGLVIAIVLAAATGIAARQVNDTWRAWAADAGPSAVSAGTYAESPDEY